MKERAVCLFSGGLDSTTVLYHALHEGYDVSALTFDYGQRHKKEIQIARAIAKARHVPHEVVNIKLPWGGNALTDGRISLPRQRQIKRQSTKIPVTYVPSRNIIFLAFAFSWAEVVGAQTVFIGANQLDYSGYPDCRGPFLKAFERMICSGTKMGVEGKRLKIKAPLLQKTKAQIIELALKLKVPVEKTWSCYAGGKKPCGECDSCRIRNQGFRQVTARRAGKKL